MRIYHILWSNMLCLLILVAATNLNAQAQAICDSLDLLIVEESDDALKIKLIIQSIKDCGISTKEEILAKTKEVKVLANRLNSDTLVMLSYQVAGRQLSVIEDGSLAATEIFQKLKQLAIFNNNLQYTAIANIGLADIFSKEGKIEEAKELLLSSIQFLKPTQLNDVKGTCYNELSHIYRNEGEYEKANAVLDTTIELLKGDTLSSQLFAAFSSKGRIQRFLGDNDSAKQFFKRAEKLALDNGGKRDLAVIYNNLGNIEHMGGQYDKALEYYFNSIQIKEDIGDFKGLSIGYHNVGAIYMDMKDWTKALENFALTSKMVENIDFKVLKVHNENKIGDVYVEIGKYDDAILRYASALENAKQVNYKNGIATSLYNLGCVHLKNEEYLKSNNYLLEALQAAQDIKSKPIESAILVELAKNYIKSPKENNLSSESNSLTNNDILQYLLSAKSLSDEMGNVENQLKVLEGLNLFYTTTNNYKEQVVILKEYLALKDTIFTKNRVEAIADWEIKYETAQKEKEILKLENESRIAEIKRKQIAYLTIAGGLFLIGVGWLGYLYFIEQNKKRQRKQRENFRSKLSSDLHDDVGTILTGLAMQTELLSSFVPESVRPNVENIASMSRDAMGKMRDTVWAIDSRKDTVDDLVHRMIDFAEESLMTKDIQLKFKSNLDEKDVKIEPEIRQNIYLIFKEAITNILKHSNAKIVNVDLISSKTELELIIQDDGIIAKEKIKTSGTGTSNMKMRAENLGGNFSLNTSNGFKILLIIPYKKKK